MWNLTSQVSHFDFRETVHRISWKSFTIDLRLVLDVIMPSPNLSLLRFIHFISAIFSPRVLSSSFRLKIKFPIYLTMPPNLFNSFLFSVFVFHEVLLFTSELALLFFNLQSSHVTYNVKLLRFFLYLSIMLFTFVPVIKNISLAKLFLILWQIVLLETKVKHFWLLNIVRNMESSTRIQIMDEAVCIFLHANALGRRMNQYILFPYVVK